MKRNTVKLFFTALLILASNRLHAQFGLGKIEEIGSVMSRKLIVLIEEPRANMLRKIARNPNTFSVCFNNTGFCVLKM